MICLFFKIIIYFYSINHIHKYLIFKMKNQIVMAIIQYYRQQ